MLNVKALREKESAGCAQNVESGGTMLFQCVELSFGPVGTDLRPLMAAVFALVGVPKLPDVNDNRHTLHDLVIVRRVGRKC